ncbi:MAG: MerR family transcriptional regulator [Hyphomonadaceae bacterium BRH_c29]|nr:MAG: MerR family transcriptional regulator [Hyphomonadaceae bacterium BRH_c29]
MSDPDIADVARRSGVPASTLRYYEEKGLIASNGRRGLKRTFDPGIFERLGLIAIGRAAGFSLDEIGAMMSPDGPRIDRARLVEKADELDVTIGQLKVMRDGLRHAADCKASSHMECPSFRRILRAATSGMLTMPDSTTTGRPGNGRK